YGEYEGYDEPGLLRLVPGYSKDGHPELKQLMIGLATTRDGIPMLADVMDGNTSDKVWNLRLVRELSRNLPVERLRQMLYVADSALVTKKNLAALADQKYHFVSRLPATFKEADEVRDAAFAADRWTDLGALSAKKNAAQYKAWETSRVIDGREYRLFVVHSTSLDRRKHKHLDSLIARERKELEQAAREEASRRYNCREDAETAFSRWSSQYWQLAHQVEEVHEKHYGHRGRPHKGEVPEVEHYYRLVIKLGEHRADAIALLRARLSTFVLISNDLRRTARQILVEYKEQQSVEQGFRFVKEPRHIAPVFLKRPDRIEAFAYLQAIALLVYTLIQKKLRDSIKQTKRPLLVPWRGEMHAPTAQIALDMMERIQTATIREGAYRRLIYTDPSDEQRYILELLGLDPLIFSAPT
ncbi:transposase (IS4 family protein), partial [mine drainage metagenome]